MSIIRIQGTSDINNRVYYEVDSNSMPLGTGGMGQVFRGKQIDSNGVSRDVAIKFLFDDLPEHVIERARREASVRVLSENLVEMIDFIQVCEEAGNGMRHYRYHVVSELLNGVMLFDLLKGKCSDANGVEFEFARRLYEMYQNERVNFAIFVVKNILSGIMALHDKGFIHRDIDPSNIMITSDGKIKIIDFGIAKQLNNLNTQDQMLTSTGQFMGKAQYAAPELVLGDIAHQNKTTDIYAIGILLYELCTGSLPFEGTTHEVLDMQLNSKMPLKNIENRELRNIIGKATEKKQANRFQSAAEFRVALEQLENKDLGKSKMDLDIKMPDMKGMKMPPLKFIVGGVAAAAVIAGVAFMFSGGGSDDDGYGYGGGEYVQTGLTDSQKQERIMMLSNKIIDSNDTVGKIDSLTGVSVKTAGMLTNMAEKELMDKNTAFLGLGKLNSVIETNFKSAARANMIMGRLYRKGVDFADEYNVMKQNLADTLKQDNRIAHEYTLKATELDSTLYEAVYELANDYFYGPSRMGEGAVRQKDKAMELYRYGKSLAEKANDTEYAEKFSKRLNGNN